MVRMNEAEVQRSEHDGSVRVIPPEEAARAALTGFRLGQEARFLLVAVGGGALRVARAAAREGVRYVETVAINGDDRVMEALDFQRRIRVELPRDGAVDEAGLPLVEPLPQLRGDLDRLFEGCTFVTIVGSLGGEAGTEVLPSVLDAAARHAPFLSVFLLKPFACEEERRRLADHALLALKTHGSFADRSARKDATLRVLDNEVAARTQRRLPFNQLDRLWGDLIASHIRDHYIVPAESALEEFRLAMQARAPLNVPAGPAPPPLPHQPHGVGPLPEALPPLPAIATASAIPPAAELEILLEVGELPPPPRPPVA